MPLSPLELYQRTLVSEFQREFEFCIDVAAGRAQDRGDFTDKLVSLAQSGLGKAFSNIPIPGASMVQTVISFALDQANAQRKSAKQDAAETLVHETDPRQLQLLLEIVAMEAARRYQWWLTERLVDDPLQGVIPFAKTGVERMLEFLLTGKRPCNESTLLQGLILGNSGGCVSDYVNTSLDVRDEETGRKAKIKKMLHLGNYTAEGAYGRTGLRTGGKQLWALAKEQSLAVKELRKVAKDVKALAKISDDYADAGYTNLKDQSQDPKYGYIDVPDSVRQALHGDVPKTKTQQRLPQLSKKLQAQLNVWQPVWVTIMRADLEQYLAQKTKQPSLLTYCQQNLPNAKKAERVFYVPDSEQDYDLTDLDFSGADCSHAVFNHVQFGQSLANSKWQHSFLRQADFSFVNDASHMNFSNAHAENLIATGVNFSGSNFTQTDLSFANLEGADLSNCQVLGTQWYQANLTDMITGQHAAIVTEQQRQVEVITRQGQELKEINRVQQAQQQQLEGLRIAITQLQTQPLQPEVKPLTELTEQLYQEQQARLVFERITEQQIKQLQQHSELTKQNQDHVIAQLQQQSSLLNQQKVDFNRMVADTLQLTEQVQRHEVKLDGLEKRCDDMRSQFEQVLTQHAEALQQLALRVAQIEIKVDHHEMRLQQVESSMRKFDIRELPTLQAKAKQALTLRYQAYDKIKGLFGPEFSMEDHYINLQMIYQGQIERQKGKGSEPGTDQEIKNKSEPFKSQRISSFEDLFGERKALNIPDLFKPAKEIFKDEHIVLKNEQIDQSPNFLLVQGRAGIGKTTFVRYAAHQWSQGKLWQEYEAVFVIPLRQLRDTQHQLSSSQLQPYTVMEFLQATCIAASGCSLAEFKGLWDLHLEQAALQDKVLVVLDGWDELPKEHRAAQALQELLTGSYKSIRKIITSRPYGIGAMPSDKRELEVIGFTDDNIKRYAAHFFEENSAQTDAFITAIRGNPAIYGTAHIPVTLNVLCGLYQDAKTHDIDFASLSTMSGLYASLEQKLTERAIEERFGKQAVIGDAYGKKQKEQKVQQFFNKHIEFLSRLAYEGLKNQQIILPPELIEATLEAIHIPPNEWREFMQQVKLLGFIKPVIEGNEAEDEQRFEFMHLSFQEYFAGKHLSQTFTQEQEAEFLAHARGNPTFQIALWFMTGLLKQDTARLQQALTALFARVVEHQASRKARPLSTTVVETHDLLGDYEASLLVRCVEESWDTRTAETLEPLLKQIHQRFLWWYQVSVQTPGIMQLSNSRFLQMIPLSPRVSSYLTEQQKPWTTILSSLIKETTINFLVAIKIFPNTVLAVLVAGLKDEGIWERRVCARALGQMGDKAATPEVLAALVAGLKDEEEDVRKACAQALGRMGDKAATVDVLAGLVAGLKDEEDVRYACAKALGQMRDKAATQAVLAALVAGLKDKELRVREACVKVLGEMGDKAATPEVITELVAGLRDQNSDVRQACASALGRMGDKAVTPEVLAALVAGLRDQEWRVREACAWALGNMGEKAVIPEAIAELAMGFKDKNQDVREACVSALGKMGHKAATPEVLAGLVAGLKDTGYGGISAACAEALGAMGDKAATVDVLVGLVAGLMDQEWSICNACAEALGAMGDKAATQVVLAALLVGLKDENEDVREGCAQALVAMGDKAVTPEVLAGLVAGLKDENEDVREGCAQALRNMGDKAATPEVLAGLVVGLKDEYMRETCAKALGKIKIEMWDRAASPEVITELVAGLKDENKDVRQACTQALDQVRYKAASAGVIVELMAGFNDKNKDVRQACAEALGRMADKAATPEVLAGLVAGFRDQEWRVREACAWALGNLGDKAATPEVLAGLVAGLKDEEKDVREACVRALGKMGHKAATPEVLAGLVAGLKDEEKDVRRACAKALGKMGDKAAMVDVFAGLVAGLKDQEWSIRNACAEALGQMKGNAATIEVLAGLVSGFKDEYSDVFEDCAEALCQMGDLFESLLAQYLAAEPLKHPERLVVLGLLAIWNSIYVSIEKSNDKIELLCQRGKTVVRHAIDPVLAAVLTDLFSHLRDVCLKPLTPTVIKHLEGEVKQLIKTKQKALGHSTAVVNQATLFQPAVAEGEGQPRQRACCVLM